MHVKMQEENCTGELTACHCIIHQETLCGKVLKMEHVINTVTQTVTLFELEVYITDNFSLFCEKYM